MAIGRGTLSATLIAGTAVASSHPGSILSITSERPHTRATTEHYAGPPTSESGARKCRSRG
jgi:hypothetical protein